MKRKRVEKRRRQANWQQIRLAKGLCPGCGQERLGFNRRRGKPFALGPICRGKKAIRQKRLMKRRRAAGLDSWTIRMRGGGVLG